MAVTREGTAIVDTENETNEVPAGMVTVAGTMALVLSLASAIVIGMGATLVSETVPVVAAPPGISDEGMKIEESNGSAEMLSTVDWVTPCKVAEIVAEVFDV